MRSEVLFDVKYKATGIISRGYSCIEYPGWSVIHGMCRNGADWNGSVLGFEDEVFDTVCGCKEAVCGAWCEWGLTPLEDVGTPVQATDIVTDTNLTKVISPLQKAKKIVSSPSGKWKAN